MDRDSHLIFEKFLLPRVKAGDLVAIRNDKTKIAAYSSSGHFAEYDIAGKIGTFLSGIKLFDLGYRPGYQIIIDKILFQISENSIDWVKTKQLNRKLTQPEDKQTVVDLSNI